LTLRPTYSIVVVVLVTAFVALHPYLGPLEFCGPGGCPHTVEAHGASHIDPVGGAAVMVMPIAALAFHPSSDRRPEEAYLSPEPPPPQLVSDR
jgi:hypothetical protein